MTFYEVRQRKPGMRVRKKARSSIWVELCPLLPKGLSESEPPGSVNAVLFEIIIFAGVFKLVV